MYSFLMRQFNRIVLGRWLFMQIRFVIGSSSLAMLPLLTTIWRSFRPRRMSCTRMLNSTMVTHHFVNIYSCLTLQACCVQLCRSLLLIGNTLKPFMKHELKRNCRCYDDTYPKNGCNWSQLNSLIWSFILRNKFKSKIKQWATSIQIKQ